MPRLKYDPILDRVRRADTSMIEKKYLNGKKKSFLAIYEEWVRLGRPVKDAKEE